MEKINNDQKSKVFTQRLDFYWQFFTAYFAVVIAYSVLKAPIINGSFKIILHDPVIILLQLFTLVTIVALVVQLFRKRSIIVGNDFIILKSRNRENRYNRNDIVRIAVGREKVLRMKGSVTVIKLLVKNRKRSIRIRPSTYWNERELVQTIIKLKKH